jgi:hypothetical protein
MADILTPTDFTAQVAQRLEKYDIGVSSPEPLSIEVSYGQDEPVVTLKLEQMYAEYEKTPDKLDVIVQPLVTEVGWTANGTRYSFVDIAEHSLPVMRDMMRRPFSEEELKSTDGSSKGPLLFQELVKRPEEEVIVQFVLAKNELIMPLYTGDMLRSFPNPAQFTQHAVQNLRRIVLELGLTLSEFKIENFTASTYLVGFRGARYRDFIASLITVPEVMKTLQETLQAQDGLVAILPSREQLLVTANREDTAVVEMGLLARHMKDEANDPVSSFIWHFNNGTLARVQTIDLSENPNPDNG